VSKQLRYLKNHPVTLAAVDDEFNEDLDDERRI
jgi:hypothetical protein